MPKRANRRIFIIGPMGRDGAVLSNTTEIKVALEDVLRSFPDFDCKIGIPQEKDREPHIPTHLFGEIDLSDLVIADISARSPCVIYELAFAHALGIPTVLIDDLKNDAAGEPIFYLNQEYTIRLQSRSHQEMVQALRPAIASWLPSGSGNRGTIEHSSNPLTRFYGGVALTDASAVAGIAAGYVENFLAPVMRAVHERYPQPAGIKPPAAVVVVEPDSLDELKEIQTKIRGQLKSAFRGGLSEDQQLVVSSNGQARSVMYVSDECGVVVDVPRTAYPLQRSGRVQRLIDQGLLAEAKEMERRLLANFMTLLKRIEEHGPRAMPRVQSADISQRLLHVVPFDELVNRVENLISPSNSASQPPNGP